MKLLDLNPLLFVNTAWGKIQDRWPVLDRLDDAPWKTWVTHSLGALAGGWAISLFTGGVVHPRWGMRIMVALYFAREWRQLDAKNPQDLTSAELFDHTMDVVAPVITTEAMWL